MNKLIELHLHLEGAVYPSDASAFSGEPSRELMRLFRHSGFNDFLKHFGKVASFFRSGDDLLLLLERHLKRIRSQGCVYVEFRVSPSVWEHFGMDARATMDKLVSFKAPGVEFNFIVEAVRHWERGLLERDLALAVEHKGRVRGFGLGGDEIAAPVGLFTGLPEECRKEGIAFIPHAGEVAGPGEVLKAVEMGAKRIGHGIGAAGSEEICARLREEGIHLEVCPTSNFKTDAVKEGDIHPLKLLLERGVPFSVSTDDPGLFLTSLPKELRLARRIAEPWVLDIGALQREALRASLLSPGEKESLRGSLLP